jgi:hypothetical protein
MIRTSLRALAASDIVRFASNGQEFTAASMSGTPGRTGTGLMSVELQNAYRDAEVSYTVRSYATPIAWLTPAGWVVPEDGYSATTKGRHLPIVRPLSFFG